MSTSRSTPTRITSSRSVRYVLAAGGVALAAFVPLLGAVGATKSSPPLAKEARDLLTRRCASCHGAGRAAGLDLRTRETLLRGGERGAAVMPGKPEESLLFRVVSGAAEPQMPPSGHLTNEEQGLLQRWIAAGAPWPGEMAAPAWSALGPLRRPPVPAVKGRWWALNPVDAFVLARLEAKGLKPAPAAARRELIRRLSFDLTGLPPTPEEVARFEADRTPGAYEALVDRLLNSPHYGERLARRWLDIVRFAESQGFERDKIRDNAWPYRDYVIRAFNTDLPYDRFVREQLAGDVQSVPTRDSIAATGMLVAGPYDEVGQSQASLVMRARVREDELEDMVSVVGQTFLGLTVNCARCHNHKFDPIPQRDYFRIQAALSGVRPGDRSALSPAEAAERHTRETTLLAEARQWETELVKLDDSAMARLAAQQSPAVRPSVATPRPVAHWSFHGEPEVGVPELVEVAGGAVVQDGRLLLPGANSFARTGPLPYPLRERTLEAWATLSTLDQRGGSLLTLEAADGSGFDGLVFGERQPRKWISGSEFFARTRDLDGPPEETSPGALIHIAATYAADGRITLYRNGVPYGESYLPPAGERSALREYPAGGAIVRFGQRHQGAGGNSFLSGEVAEARLYDRVLTAADIRASFQAGPSQVTPGELEAVRTPEERAERVRVLTALGKVRAVLAELRTIPQVYAVIGTVPPPVHLLNRGDVAQPREPIAPAGLSCLLESQPEWNLPPNASDGERRRQLAEWVAGPNNSLTPRVMANRVWQLLFGRGLAGSPSDFGVNGEPPTHPELLDWLADTFRSPRTPADREAQGWSVKRLVRLLVTSNTYKQGSRFDPVAARIDSENHLLWRRSPRRLEAEEVRDAALAVSEQLNSAMGGPGYRPFAVTQSNSTFYSYEDRIGPEYNRRSIYRTLVNGGSSPLLDVFDCPDPSVKTPRRGNTVTPLQALSLLNNSFVIRQSREMARQVEKSAGTAAERQVEVAYERAYSRPPTPEERSRAAQFVRAHGLAPFCRVLLNSSEFLYVR